MTEKRPMTHREIWHEIGMRYETTPMVTVVR
jgi:hypothetical protein